jgi:hypothetical protein
MEPRSSSGNNRPLYWDSNKPFNGVLSFLLVPYEIVGLFLSCFALLSPLRSFDFRKDVLTVFDKQMAEVGITTQRG